MARPTVYQLTEERRQWLRAHYGSMPAWKIAKLPLFRQEPEIPSWVIRRWAMDLQVTATSPIAPSWSPEEDAQLEDAWSGKLRGWPVRGLKRSRAAAAQRARKLNLDDGYYSARDLGDLLGVHHTKVLGWEKAGWLHAGAGPHKYTPFDLGKFLWKHPAEAYSGPITFELFISMLSHLKLASRPVERQSPKGKAS